MLEIIVSVADVIYQIAMSLFFLAGSIMFFTVSVGFTFIAVMLANANKDSIDDALLTNPFDDKE